MHSRGGAPARGGGRGSSGSALRRGGWVAGWPPRRCSPVVASWRWPAQGRGSGRQRWGRDAAVEPGRFWLGRGGVRLVGRSRPRPDGSARAAGAAGRVGGQLSQHAAARIHVAAGRSGVAPGGIAAAVGGRARRRLGFVAVADRRSRSLRAARARRANRRSRAAPEPRAERGARAPSAPSPVDSAPPPSPPSAARRAMAARRRQPGRRSPPAAEPPSPPRPQQPERGDESSGGATVSQPATSPASSRGGALPVRAAPARRVHPRLPAGAARRLHRRRGARDRADVGRRLCGRPADRASTRCWRSACWSSPGTGTRSRSGRPCACASYWAGSAAATGSAAPSRRWGTPAG